MWPYALSGRLPIVALVGRCPANWLIGRGSIPYHRSFSHRTMRYCALMRFYRPFPAAIPRYGAGSPRVTHPSATMPSNHTEVFRWAPFDLHVLSTPPAFILSQDRTLMLKIQSIDEINRDAYVPFINESVLTWHPVVITGYLNLLCLIFDSLGIDQGSLIRFEE